MGDRFDDSEDSSYGNCDKEWYDKEVDEDVDGEDIYIHVDDESTFEAHVEGERAEVRAVKEEHDVKDVDREAGDADYDPRLEGYRSCNESELKDMELACSENNPYVKIATATRVIAFIKRSDGNILLKVGMTFVSLEHFRQVLLDYRVKEGFTVHFKHNDKRRVRAK